ncbi:MAG: type II secretion system F family protein [Planctomycetia bacterium]|nr:type II secretion system F family protein [Planctomycetia bacterium]
MPDYRYKAKNRAGKDFQGLLSANTKKDALDMLARQGLFPLEVDDARKGEIDPSKWFTRRPADSLIAAFLHQLADLLENGVPVLNAFDVLSKQETQPVLKDMITDIHDRIAEGEDIASAFEQHSRIFSDLTISIIRAGSEGAFLEDALRRTAKFLEEQGEIRSKIINAMIYPMILAFVGTLVVSVLLIFIVPRFEPMFESIKDRGRDLPLVTIWLLQFKGLVGRYGLWMLGGGIAAFIFLRIQMASRMGRKFIDTWKLKLPIIGPVALNSAVSRLCRVLGTLLSNGVPILRALEISSRSTGNMLLTDAVEQAVENVASGEPLSKPFAKAGLFPASVMTMITIAEESNNLENVLINVADGIERQLSKKLDLLVRLLEPLMLLFMAGAVFYIIVALLLPILMMTEAT